jgi:hypothetical protein
VRARLAIAILAGTLLAAAPATRPVATIAPGGQLDITLPANILRNDEVRKHLTSGLTTVFLLTANDGGARVEIRYELWDEKFLVAVIDGERRVQKTSIDTFEHLADWWSRTPLRTGKGQSEVRAKLEVIPFSAREEEDAQRWLARSIGESSNTADPAQRNDATARTGSILDLLIGTSVQRHPLQTWRWTLRAEKPR